MIVYKIFQIKNNLNLMRDNISIFQTDRIKI